jgi:hypothetical protein
MYFVCVHDSFLFMEKLTITIHYEPTTAAITACSMQLYYLKTVHFIM